MKEISTIRLQKYFSDKAIASRRKTEEWIEAGYIYVNGEKITDCATKIDPKKDNITLDKKITQQKKYYFLFNKPKGIVTVNAQKGEKEIKNIISIPKGVVPVGRLDKDSMGLILLTNDGVVARRLMEPKFNHEKEYLVNVYKPLTIETIKKLEKGMYMRGQKTKPAKIKLINKYKCTITLKEGKNRQIRKMCSRVGCPAKKLIRIRIGKFNLGKLLPGQIKRLNQNEINTLYKSCNLLNKTENINTGGFSKSKISKTNLRKTKS
ncbi:pseudouridine synthase [Candidatus Margulisiibacteriota bacterium]